MIRVSLTVLDLIQFKFYLVVKGSVGPLFDWSLFLLISDLNDHTGVDVFSHQLSGLSDVDGNLWDKNRLNLYRYVYFCLIYWNDQLCFSSPVISMHFPSDSNVLFSLFPCWSMVPSVCCKCCYLEALRFPLTVLDASFQLGPAKVWLIISRLYDITVHL